jgi:hypothetical protein
MNKSTIVAPVITVIQIIGVIRLYFTHKYRSSQFPADLIELNIFAIFNFIFLITYYFLFFKTENKYSIWSFPIIIAFVTIFLLLVIYIIMFYNKYK